MGERGAVEVVVLGGGKELGGIAGAGGDAGTAADARRGVHGRVGRLLGHGDEVGVGRRARGGGDVAAGLDDAVERGPVDDEVAQHGEGGCTPGLDVDVLAVAEHAHVHLAGGGALSGTGGLAV